MNLPPSQRAPVQVCADSCSTGHEYAEHLERVAALLPDVRLSTRVEQVARERLLKSEQIASELGRDTPLRLLLCG